MRVGLSSRRGLWAAVALLLFIASACASDPDTPPLAAAGDEDSAEADEAVIAEQPTATPDPTPTPRAVVDLASLPAAADDASFPEGVNPDYPVGAYGFTRYVWTSGSAGVLPTLVEGPRGQQYRCQDLDLPCSYNELKALHESGDPIPPELGMTDAELAELVDQLDTVRATVESMASPDDVCAAGYSRSSSQNPNMGIHMVNAALIGDGFDPAHPEILLLAHEGGEALLQSEIGECVDGSWTGDPAFEVVGAAFMLPMTPEHPEGFAGPIDNWHVHYNTCTGANSESGNLGDPAKCAAEGGRFMEVLPVWMMHAYTNPDYDSQEGVFAMFNGAIWPLSDGGSIQTERTEADFNGSRLQTIVNFEIGTVTARPGEQIVFSNGDSVPHTVTSSEPDAPGAFDTGVLGGGQTWAGTFDTPGEYQVFCSLHPQMTGTVIVEE
ncbi:MAG: hypothetical protein KDB21_11240 [Acidimicrobiales bacterium]|nr:hypothetical protein [Acidimicrobiales bacterium]